MLPRPRDLLPLLLLLGAAALAQSTPQPLPDDEPTEPVQDVPEAPTCPPCPPCDEPAPAPSPEQVEAVRRALEAIDHAERASGSPVGPQP